jgi:hypothetical protein
MLSRLNTDATAVLASTLYRWEVSTLAEMEAEVQLGNLARLDSILHSAAQDPAGWIKTLTSLLPSTLIQVSSSDLLRSRASLG